MDEAKDCPWCGLVNPPSAQRCDCGYDFTQGLARGTYLSANDLARQGDARLPVYVPTGCVSASFLVIFGLASRTNGPGVCLPIIAACVAVAVGEAADCGAGAYLAAFGLSAVALDALALRFSAWDLRRGSRLAGLPVWVVGLSAFIVGVSFLLP